MLFDFALRHIVITPVLERTLGKLLHMSYMVAWLLLVRLLAHVSQACRQKRSQETPPHSMGRASSWLLPSENCSHASGPLGMINLHLGRFGSLQLASPGLQNPLARVAPFFPCFSLGKGVLWCLFFSLMAAGHLRGRQVMGFLEGVPQVLCLKVCGSAR